MMYENRIMKLTRSCIYAKDIQRITGKSERYGRSVLQQIRVQLNKAPHQFITLTEFANYSGIDVEVVEQYITD